MSTYNTKGNVIIGGVKINKYKSIKVNKSLDGSSATVIFPDNLKIGSDYLYKSGSTNPLGTGQSIAIDMGWDKLRSNDASFTTDGVPYTTDDIDNPQNYHFTGFVSKITQNFKSREIVVECEDFNYLLKRTKFNFSVKSIGLVDLGKRIVSEIPSNITTSMNLDYNIVVNYQSVIEVISGIDFTLKKFVADKVTGYEILKHIDDEYNIKSCFVNNQLIIGINYLNPNTNAEKEYRFTQVPRAQQTTNMLYALDTGGLTWQNYKDVKYLVTANVIDKTLEKTEYKLGDDDGQGRELWFYGDYDEKQVKELVVNELSRLKYDGFKEGSKITAFGRMSSDYRDRGMNILDTIIMDGIDYRNESDGEKTVLPTTAYLCSAITYTMDDKGFMADITLGQLFKQTVDSLYETNSSFNNNNLEYTSTYQDFEGITKVNVATGSVAVEKVVEPVVEEEEASEGDIKKLKNILGKYKTSNDIVIYSLQEQTTNLSNLGWNSSPTAVFSNPNLSNKSITFERASADIYKYSFLTNGSTEDDWFASYNPKYTEDMVANNPTILNAIEVASYKSFNESNKFISTNTVNLIEYSNTIISVENDDSVYWNLDKLTFEEKYLYDAILRADTTSTAILMYIS